MRRRVLGVAPIVVLSLLGCADPSSSVLEPNDAPAPPSSAAQVAQADHPFLPGEEQPTARPDLSPLAIYPIGVGQVLRQTFRPRSNQRLGFLEIPVACAPGVLLNVKIRDQDGTVLSDFNTIGLTGGIDGVFDLIQVADLTTSNGIPLRQNRRYAFELSAFPGPDAVGNTCAIASGPPTNSYPRGRGFYQDPINGPAFLPLPNGAEGDNEDLPFRTLVR